MKGWWTTAALLLLAASGCTRSAEPGTVLWFEVENRRYELNQITLTTVPLGAGNRKFLDLGVDPSGVAGSRPVPSATIQWKMNLDALTELQGRELDLSRPEHNAVVQFVLGDSGTGLVHETDHPSFNLRIRRVDEGLIEGTFHGEDFSLVSSGDLVRRGVTVEGEFRAAVATIQR